MDPATHALISFALARGIFPRRPWWFVLGVVLAGTIADLDLVSTLVGPAAYLSIRHTITHSILGTAVVIGAALICARLLRMKGGPSRKPIRDAENAPQKAAATADGGIAALLVAATLAAVVHVLMDLCTSAGVALLWPWRETRFAWDWLPGVDMWIPAILLAGILLPELFGLVGSEIGAKERAPRGHNGAIAALVLVLIYVGARATLHGTAVAQLDAHTYRGESPRRFAAIADPVSLLNWHGVVETDSQICTLSVPATEGTRFDPESGACMHKPGESPALEAAQQTNATKNFLRAARFPRASVGTTEDGTEVVLRDLRDSAEDEKRFAVAARILLDRKGRVTDQQTLWASEVHLR
ncbi:MAG TPA: metal-dependent hydrolase [Candidatus Sulfotelmatobacter sp.]|nr:metal-dependent hydrolase [Candidatus Sulfotelmatobacter sp.]